MKSFFNYVRTFRFSQVQRPKFGLVFVWFIVFFVITGQYFNHESFSLDVTFLTALSAIATSYLVRNRYENIGPTSLYPISYKKKVAYNAIYTILNGVLALCMLIIAALVFLGIMYVFFPEHITFEPTESLIVNKGFYYYAFSISYISFSLLASYIKDDTKWKLTILFGNVGYFLLNVLIVSLYSGKFKVFGHIQNLVEKAPNTQIYMHILSGLLCVLAIVFYVVSLNLKKPKNTEQIDLTSDVLNP